MADPGLEQRDEEEEASSLYLRDSEDDGSISLV